jgi:hypothetical protein
MRNFAPTYAMALAIGWLSQRPMPILLNEDIVEEEIDDNNPCNITTSFEEYDWYTRHIWNEEI